MKKEELVEVVSSEEIFETKVIEIQDDSGDDLESAHGGQDKIFKIRFNKKFKGPFVLRKKS